MKIRNDFVSNSSSSSFIVFKSDNDRLDVLKNVEHLSLRQYLDRFIMREIYDEDDWHKTGNYKTDMKFVLDEEFSDKFVEFVGCMLPISAKDAWEKLMRCQEIRQKFFDENDYSDDEDESLKSKVDELYDNEDAAEKAVVDIIEKVLSPKYANEIFDYAEIEDRYIEDLDDSEMSLVLKELNANNLKFYRYFNNH